MNAHWWEFCPPGLQALGGIIELYGAVILAKELYRSTREQQDAARRGESLTDPALYRRFHSAMSTENSGPGTLQVLEAIKTWAARSNRLRTDLSVSEHRRLYIIGFALIMLGVVLQIAANMIAAIGAMLS